MPTSRTLAVQSPGAALLVSAHSLRFNVETAADNDFQDVATLAALMRDAAAVDGARAALDALHARAVSEHDALQAALARSGVRTVTFGATAALGDSPDACFPNNWFSTHADGRLVLYPMQPVSRRSEARPEIVAFLRALYPHVLDLSGRTADGVFLEGTGSLVFDHIACRAFMSRSLRSDEGLAKEVCEFLGYELVAFDAASSRSNHPIYHTNVLLSIGATAVLVCLDVVAAADRARVAAALALPGRPVVAVTEAQLGAFVCNSLEFAVPAAAAGDASAQRAVDAQPPVALAAAYASTMSLCSGDAPARRSAAASPSETTLALRAVWMMPQSGWDALDATQRATLSADASIAPVSFETIQRLGGGSVRCCLAQLF